MTESLEKLQTELIVTEEKESERFNALKESEKVCYLWLNNNQNL